MEYTYQYSWIIPFIPLPIPILIGVGLLLFPTSTKNLHCIWVFPSVLLLSIVMICSIYLAIQQINNSSIHLYGWSWTINNGISFESGYLVDPLASIMLILITTVGIMVLIYTFVTNRVGDFGLLLGILGFYSITCSLEFWDLFEIFKILVYNNEVKFFYLLLYTHVRGFTAVAKSTQFLLHVWLPDTMEGPTPISALIHVATMVGVGIFLVARLLPLFILALGMESYRDALFHLITHAYSKAFLFLGFESIIHSMEMIVGYSPDKSQNMVCMGGLRKHVPITKTSFLLGTLSLCGIPPRFHLITHAYSKALLFLGSRSIIHSMEMIVGYSPDKSQNMVCMGGLRKHVPITKTSFLLGTLSLCGIPPRFHLITHAYSKALLFLGSRSIIHSMEMIVGYSPDKS
ncbi:hypothetical protein UlMin_023662 [Ulmus minor]